MPICPSGHESQSEDYCDYCGLAMRPAAAVGAPGPFGAPVPPPPAGPPAQGGYPGAAGALPGCPICRTPKTGRYCEECGYDFELSTSHGMQVLGANQYQQQQPQQHQPQPGYGYPPAPPQQPAHPPVQQQPGYGYPPPGPAYPGQPDPNYPGQPEPSYPGQPEPSYLGQPDPGYPQADPYGTAPGYPPPVEPAAPPVAPQQPPAPSIEQFGTSFHLAPPSQQMPQAEPVRSTWMAVISADRDYFTDMMARSGPEASGLFFPPYCPERRIPITGRGQLRIGRRSQHRGTVPEIDLSVPPEDPGASHQHALLAEQPDGSWVLVDQDSTNGTTMNGGSEPIAPHTAIALNDGDRIHIGAWTTITLHRA
ncbi:FHA domain-containing protein [Kitasatospora viridis]|uniref:FHA domain-containing protein n=1 Tax=Kitasatospora viridis TaxID=281105 RepID=A0A561UDT6_9ACTN|nr:FHA domain-containing protein [Kitasatospora viridis]TWF97498.1 FHA domain-containing protein [Kitasatospora viridis]